MTYFPFPGAKRGRPGAGEVGTTLFSVPEGSLPWWHARLTEHGVGGLAGQDVMGEARLYFDGPDGERFALTEVAGDTRTPWTGGGVSAEHAIRGFHGAHLRVNDGGATEELLRFMGYGERAREGATLRLAMEGGNGAGVIEVETTDAAPAQQGAGSVHHIAFSVADRAAQLEVRQALAKAGAQITPVIDRDYFWAIYFRTPAGILFEVATDEPGFDRDEDPAALGRDLKLPGQHEHLRPMLEAKYLEPIHD